ncbi:Hypothetical protein A7982_10777 [Minicystis rosea]|nr:Hypothetical protein A7982_10777 [Minicystis rosea]
MRFRGRLSIAKEARNDGWNARVSIRDEAVLDVGTRVPSR